MPLPILRTTSIATDQDLVRLFHRSELLWTQHLGEEATLEVGTAMANPQLPHVPAANGMLDVALPDGMSAPDAIEVVDVHYRSLNTHCRQWILNPAAPASATAPLDALLRERGWTPTACDILHLGDRPRGVLREVGGLTIIPGRASYKHARQLADQAAAEAGEPQLADATVLHLDDPHTDALLAMRDGVAAGTIAVLAVGDIGRIDGLYVAPAFRRQSVARTLLSRALEICARSLFKHVMLSVASADQARRALVSEVGFRKVGEIVAYRSQ